MWPQLGHTGVSSYARRAVTFLDGIGIHTSVSGLEAISNILMFIPFGILGVAILVDLPLFRSLNTGLVGDAVKVTILAAGTSALIELAQLAIPGRVTDLNDLIRNTLGALVGASIAASYFKLRDQNRTASFVRGS